MDITLTLNISLDHVEGTPRASKEEILAEIIEVIGEPQMIHPGDDDAQYEVTIWDAEEA